MSEPQHLASTSTGNQSSSVNRPGLVPRVALDRAAVGVSLRAYSSWLIAVEVALIVGAALCPPRRPAGFVCGAV
jgi:hypothetical protein